MSREQDLVELVDTDGRVTGEATVAHAHTAPGQLHRAFSVHLLDGQGRLLLQQRAAGKTRFALRWANATCGHPLPGEPVTTSAARRMIEEIGVRDIELTEIGVYTYLATDPSSGRVEREYDHVLLGILDTHLGRVRPDPAEVASLRWIRPEDLDAELRARPDDFAPWLAGVTEIALGVLD